VVDFYHMVFALSIFLGTLSIINKILLFIEKKSGWLSGIAIGLISGFYFWIIDLKILSISEAGFFLVMLYGYIRHTHPSLKETLKFNLILSALSLLLCYFLFVGLITFIETISALSFIWGGYFLAINKKTFGWLLFLLAHTTTAFTSFYVEQVIFSILQLISGLICIYAILFPIHYKLRNFNKIIQN